MELNYSVHYDCDVFIGDKRLMGTIYLGTQQLLQQLELRGGIPQSIKSDVERESDYMNAMSNHIEGSIFEKPATVDRLGVARKLLQWRDNLIMAGWDGTCDNEASPKIKILANIEKDFHSIGNADRWKAVAEAYTKFHFLKDMVINVECPWVELPFLVQKTLSAIRNNGIIVNELTADKAITNINLDKIQVLEFHDVNEAYEWIANATRIPKDSLVVNRNNIRLNHILYSWDKPLVGASFHDSNPQILQLFKLGLSIFSRPLNIKNLTSYMLLPISPIPSALRNSLVKLLLKEGGFGKISRREDGKLRDEWDETIRLFPFLNNEGKPTPQARSKKMVFLTPIRRDYSLGIDKKELIIYLDTMLKWIFGLETAGNFEEEVSMQLQELRSLFNSLKIAIQTLPATITYSDINKLVQSIYRPMNYRAQFAENGSLNVVSDIRQMAVPANNIIWLDCQDEDKEKDPYDFLVRSERDYLSSKGIHIPDFHVHLINKRLEIVSKINSVKSKVTLVKSSYDGTMRLGEHSIISEVSYSYKSNFPEMGRSLPLIDKETILHTDVNEVRKGSIETFHPQKAYKLNSITNLKRKESNHSIDTLINFPFDYVMQYIAKLYQPDEEQVNNTFITIGLVAHSFFEDVITDSASDTNKMRQLVDKEFEKRLNTSIDETGLILRLPENASELRNFTIHLKESILTLIDIMETLRLHPVGCEIDLPQDEKCLSLNGIGDFGARIDLLLADKEGNYVIFDFKWSYSKSYEKKLCDNHAIQLELYREAVKAAYPDKKVAGVGYYLMPRRLLVTCDFNVVGNKTIKHITFEGNSSDLFSQIQNSYRFRMKELETGHIEEAEELNVLGDDGCYYSHEVSDNLCPLEMNKNKDIWAKKVSNSLFRPTKKPRFENSDIEPSEKPTINAILKGRLK